jgi:hypothetical protein
MVIVGGIEESDMITSRQILITASSVLCCLGLRVSHAQSVTAPISVANKTQEVLNGSRYFIVTLRNDTQKSVVGILVRCALLDAEGKVVDNAILGGVTLDANVDRHDPGASWKVQVEAMSPNHPEIDIRDVRPEADYVLFRDLSSSGPDVEKRGILLRREYEGSQMQLARLRRLLQTKGIEAVKEVLDREEPRFGRFSKP